ncbi:acetylneuraminic acid synthetase [Marinomonas sp. A3A]|nr:acetylneuraminic acid synthetase [Marinomonas sp. A3A]
MILNKNITGYLISADATLQEALAKINENKHRLVYVVDNTNHLLGSLSDGDVRRWLLTNSALDLAVKVIHVAKQPCFSMQVDDEADEIENAFNERILSIPLVDLHGHLIAVAEPRPTYFQIGSKRVSQYDPAFIIAEIGNNHQGDIQLAKRLVDLAVEAEVDCIKFQMRNVSKLYRNAGASSDASADLGAQYTLDLLAKFQLTDDELFEVFDYCKSKGTLPLCTPWDLDSLYKLETYGMPAYKVASADFTNYELLEVLAKTGKPIICSTGMSTETEIQSTVSFLKKKHAQFILLHCNSTYPTPFKDVNLNYIKRLATSTNSLIGYSGHERGWSVPVASIALGAKVIEKHFTIDRSLEGSDHKVSLLPNELKQMVKQIRQVEEALGNDKPREITQGELMNREVLAKSLIINQSLNVGEVITESMIDIKSPGQGLQPNRIHELVGKTSIREFKTGDFFFESDISGQFNKKGHYNFNRPYGIPVRYHDYQALTADLDLDFVEFHLSYRDLEVTLSEYIKPSDALGFAVHAPELFAGDHILDLSSEDEVYRKHSIAQLTRVIEQAKELMHYFPKTKKPVIVVNAGGWNTHGFLSKEIKEQKYARVKASFEEMDLMGVEIAIQTMPPFPWHFGGQSYHNLFLDPYEIRDFCKNTGLKVCLDISHSMMSCNHYGWDLYDFVRIVAPYNVHMHIVDAKADDGEGIQIGQGDVDFEKLGRLLNEVSPNIQFIPEVWQGHKNRGQGFWSALSYLERML